MRIAPPLITLAALTTGASARDKLDKKDRTRTNADDVGKKRQTIFHKVDPNEDGDARVRQSILGSVETRQRDQQRKRRERGENSMDVMEKKTNVKREEIVRQGLSRRTILKEKRLKRQEAEGSTDGSAATAAEPAVPSELVNGVDEKPTAAAADSSSLLRKPDDTSPFEFEKWDEFEGTATPPPAVVPEVEEPDVKLDAKSMQPDMMDLMKKRRKDRAADLVQKKERRAQQAAAAGPNGEAAKRGSRMTTPKEPRQPNPRPGRRKAMTDDKLQRRTERKEARNEARQRHRDMRAASSGKVKAPRPGYDKRDLKKSKKSSHSSGSSSKSSGNEKVCEVHMTNLTKEQWFGDIFWMVHSDKVELPLFEYGEPAFDDLALLAQDGDPDELIDFYEDNDDGVLDVDAEPGFIEEGDSIYFDIPKSGSYDLLTLATNFIFSNDGFVALDAVDIEDGAEWYLWGIDAGVEANTQLCWTVPATSEDFPPNAECYYIDEDIADENDNQFVGEGFVFVHAGIHDLDDKNDLKDFLAFTCDDNDADSFVEYFQEIGFDDDVLLYDDDRGRNERDDQSFLDFLEDNEEDYENYVIVEIALDAGDFDTFCDDLDDIADFLYNAFETLEPQVFDFRTPMMRVELDC